MKNKNYQSWQWSADESTLTLKNSERSTFVILCAFIFLSALYCWINFEWIINTSFFLTIAISIFSTVFLGLIIKTTTFQNDIRLNEIEEIVDKGILFQNKIAIKLSNNKYRVLKFNNNTEKIEFIDQLSARRIPLVKRKYSWSMPIFH